MPDNTPEGGVMRRGLRWTMHEALVHGYADPEVPEAALEGWIQQFCKEAALLYYHTRDSRKSAPGWPDTAIIHPAGGTLFLIENKAREGTVSPQQQRWLDALAHVTSVYVDVVRPAGWPALRQRLLQEGRKGDV